MSTKASSQICEIRVTYIAGSCEKTTVQGLHGSRSPPSGDLPDPDLFSFFAVNQHFTPRNTTSTPSAEANLEVISKDGNSTTTTAPSRWWKQCTPRTQPLLLLLHHHHATPSPTTNTITECRSTSPITKGHACVRTFPCRLRKTLLRLPPSLLFPSNSCCWKGNLRISLF